MGGMVVNSLVHSWNTRGYGLYLDLGTLNHVIWADNAWVFSNCLEQLQIMLQGLTDAVYAAGFGWKATSMEVLASNCTEPFSPTVKTNNGALRYAAVERMVALGSALARDGATNTSLDHRLEIAETVFWKHTRVLKGRGGLCERMKAWAVSPGSSAIFGATSCHPTRALLHKVKAWEYRMLRRMFAMRFHPGEGLYQYNQRTARRLEEWFRKTKVQQLHHRILDAIYKGACRERSLTVAQGDKPLRWARAHRNEMWCQTLKALGRHERRREGIQQRSSGHRTQWEDIFVNVLGLTWRQQMDTCRDRAEWECGRWRFINAVCDRWHLPGIQVHQGQSCPRADIGLARTIDQAPSVCEHPSDTLWDRGARNFRFVVDCQPLAEILNGRWLLADISCHPLFVRLARMLAELLQDGWQPRRPWDDPVEWRGRDWNGSADFMCNLAMDTQQSWHYLDMDKFVDCRRKGCNLQMHTDGGLRSHGCAATERTLHAWIVTSTGNWRRILLGMGCTYLQGCPLSFHAEAMALEGGMDILLKVAQTRHDQL